MHGRSHAVGLAAVFVRREVTSSSTPHRPSRRRQQAEQRTRPGAILHLALPASRQHLKGSAGHGRHPSPSRRSLSTVWGSKRTAASHEARLCSMGHALRRPSSRSARPETSLAAANTREKAERTLMVMSPGNASPLVSDRRCPQCSHLGPRLMIEAHAAIYLRCECCGCVWHEPDRRARSRGRSDPQSDDLSPAGSAARPRGRSLA